MGIIRYGALINQVIIRYNNYIVTGIVEGQEDPVFNTFIYIYLINISISVSHLVYQCIIINIHCILIMT